MIVHIWFNDPLTGLPERTSLATFIDEDKHHGQAYYGADAYGEGSLGTWFTSPSKKRLLAMIVSVVGGS